MLGEWKERMKWFVIKRLIRLALWIDVQHASSLCMLTFIENADCFDEVPDNVIMGVDFANGTRPTTH
jgi:hypothetical protein